MSTRLWENSNGVHADSAIGYDTTLCGQGLEGEPGDATPCVEVDGAVVTCWQCIAIIRFCKALKVRMKRAENVIKEGKR